MKLSPQDRIWFDKVLRAIAAAEAGPSDADIAQAPILSDWKAAISPGGHIMLWGEVSDHPLLGTTSITTSQLIAIDPEAGWARTASRWYRLGRSIDGSSTRCRPGPHSGYMSYIVVLQCSLSGGATDAASRRARRSGVTWRGCAGRAPRRRWTSGSRTRVTRARAPEAGSGPGEVLHLLRRIVARPGNAQPPRRGGLTEQL